jgi:hypothetical protein
MLMGRPTISRKAKVRWDMFLLRSWALAPSVGGNRCLDSGYWSAASTNRGDPEVGSMAIFLAVSDIVSLVEDLPTQWERLSGRATIGSAEPELRG